MWLTILLIDVGLLCSNVVLFFTYIYTLRHKKRGRPSTLDLFTENDFAARPSPRQPFSSSTSSFSLPSSSIASSDHIPCLKTFLVSSPIDHSVTCLYTPPFATIEQFPLTPQTITCHQTPQLKISAHCTNEQCFDPLENPIWCWMSQMYHYFLHCHLGELGPGARWEKQIVRTNYAHLKGYLLFLSLRHF